MSIFPDIFLALDQWVVRENVRARAAWVADPDAVLISKAYKAPEKNMGLITEYLAKGASERFFELAQKYAVDLEQFV